MQFTKDIINCEKTKLIEIDFSHAGENDLNILELHS